MVADSDPGRKVEGGGSPFSADGQAQAHAQPLHGAHEAQGEPPGVSLQALRVYDSCDS